MSPMSTQTCTNNPALNPLYGNEAIERIINRWDKFQKDPTIRSILNGAFGAACSTLLFQPLDLVKTRMQSYNSMAKLPVQQNHIGMVKVFAQVIKQEKIGGLWKGTVASLVRCIPGAGIYFGSLPYLQKRICCDPDKPTALEALTAGTTARSIAAIALLPATVIKIRYESGLFSYPSLSEAFKRIYSKEGAKGMFAGLFPTLTRDALYSGLYYMCYSQLKISFIGNNDHEDNCKDLKLSNPVKIFTCGLIAGVAASIVTHPFDMIKTKMQIEAQRYPSFVETTVTIFTEKGSAGFFRGLAPKVLRRALMTATTWTIYENLIKKD